MYAHRYPTGRFTCLAVVHRLCLHQPGPLHPRPDDDPVDQPPRQRRRTTHEDEPAPPFHLACRDATHSILQRALLSVTHLATLLPSDAPGTPPATVASLRTFLAVHDPPHEWPGFITILISTGRHYGLASLVHPDALSFLRQFAAYWRIDRNARAAPTWLV